MVILKFMYGGSRQLYQLDDNTITMEGLVSKIRVLDQRMKDVGFRVCPVRTLVSSDGHYIMKTGAFTMPTSYPPTLLPCCKPDMA